MSNQDQISKRSPLGYNGKNKSDDPVSRNGQLMSNWFSWLQQEVEQNEDDQERLLSLFTFLEWWLPDSNFRGCAFLNIAAEFPSPDSKIRLLVVNHKNALQDYIRQLVDRLNISIKKNNTAMLADFIHLLFEGVITKSQIYRSTRSIEAAREAVRQLIS